MDCILFTYRCPFTSATDQLVVIGIRGFILAHQYNLAKRYFYCYKLVMMTYISIIVLTHSCRSACSYKFVCYFKNGIGHRFEIPQYRNPSP